MAWPSVERRTASNRRCNCDSVRSGLSATMLRRASFTIASLTIGRCTKSRLAAVRMKSQTRTGYNTSGRLEGSF